MHVQLNVICSERSAKDSLSHIIALYCAKHKPQSKAPYFSKLSYHTKCQEAASDSNCVTSAKDVPTNTVLVTPTIGSHELQSFDFVWWQDVNSNFNDNPPV